MLTVKKLLINTLSAAAVASAGLIVPLCILNLVRVFHSAKEYQPFETVTRRGIQCVRAQGNNTVESLAALVKRNQLAVYIASLYHARLSFSSLGESDQGFTKHFSDCFSPEPECIIKRRDVGYLNCPRSDCICISMRLSKHIHSVSDCMVLGVENFGRSSYEYSGCMGDVLRRYFGQPSLWPRPYDAVHFVDGTHEPDVGKVVAGKSFSPDRFRHLMHALCVLSDRDIIVVTDGQPEIPLCGNRTVLANVNMFEAMKIMQHARHLSVGSNSLGMLMMEMSTPERVVLLSEVYKRFLWLKSPLITLIRKDGHMFNFSGRELLGDVEMALELQNFSSESVDALTEPTTPPRKWEDEAEL